MRDAGITGTIVPWDDVLHEGPVPEGLGPAALQGAARGVPRRVRLGSARIDPAQPDRTRLHPRTRGSGRERCRRRDGQVDEIVLWLEHDLYDQLQRLQILDRVPLDGTPRITAVRDDEYLGTLPAERFRESCSRAAPRSDVRRADRGA